MKYLIRVRTFLMRADYTETSIGFVSFLPTTFLGLGFHRKPRSFMIGRSFGERLSIIHSSKQATPFHSTIMIYFQTKPDNVFDTIVQEALISESAEVKILADDGAIESWEGLYPESSQRLTPYSAVRIMHQLFAACRDAMVYRLSEDHWLILYECIKKFCSSRS